MGTKAQGKRKHPSDEEDQDDEESIVVPIKQEMRHEVTASSVVNSVRDVSEPELPCPWNGASYDTIMARLSRPSPLIVHLLYQHHSEGAKWYGKVPAVPASSCSLRIARDIQLHGHSKTKYHYELCLLEAKALLHWLYMRRPVYEWGPRNIADQWKCAQNWIVPEMANAAMRAMISIFDSAILGTSDDVKDALGLVEKIAEVCDENSLLQLLLMYAIWFSRRYNRFELHASLLLPLTKEGSKYRKLCHDTSQWLDNFYDRPEMFHKGTSCIADHSKRFMVTAKDLVRQLPPQEIARLKLTSFASS